MKIPDSVIQEIKYRSDIVDVISGYVQLKRAGSNMNGLCPFHSEKTPSFTVFQSTNNFYCFGCGSGGDVITFIMKQENLSYPEAIEFLGRRAGIEVQLDEEEEKLTVKKNRLYQMNREAAKFFHECLLNTEKYPVGMAYFNKRQLSMPMIRHFGLGYAPNEFDAISDHLKKKGYTEQEMLVGFLRGKSTKSGKERYFDYFRNRVIFPIIDLSGNIVAFGGRVMDDSIPKYLNTSDTPAFKKSRNLFALNFAKDHCAEQLILCEGYMDVIALHGAGFQNAVATLGTAITPEHARIMKRYTKSVLISYDSDEAGQRAADKAFRLLSEVGIDTRVLKVEGAKDPDEYIRKNGAEGFRKFISESRTEFEFKFDAILQKHDLSKTDEKIKACDETTKLIAAFYSDVERELYINAAAKKLGVSAETLRSDVEKRRSSGIRKQHSDDFQKIVSTAGGYGDRINPDFVKNPAAAAAEEAILGMMMLRPELLAAVAQKKLVDSNDFVTDFGRKVFTYIVGKYEEDGAFEEGCLSESFNLEETGRIVQMKIRRLDLRDNTEKVLCECADKLRGSKKSEDKLQDLQNIIGSKRRKTSDGE